MQQGNDEKAFGLIDSFAKELLALNGEKKIPTAWMIRLKGKLAASKSTSGRKRNNEEVREIVKQLTLHREEINIVDRTKQNSPADIKNLIAKNLGVTRKKVDRALIDIDDVLKSLDSLVPETRQAYIEGISDAILEEIKGNIGDSGYEE